MRSRVSRFSNLSLQVGCARVCALERIIQKNQTLFLLLLFCLSLSTHTFAPMSSIYSISIFYTISLSIARSLARLLLLLSPRLLIELEPISPSPKCFFKIQNASQSHKSSRGRDTSRSSERDHINHNHHQA